MADLTGIVHLQTSELPASATCCQATSFSVAAALNIVMDQPTYQKVELLCTIASALSFVQLHKKLNDSESTCLERYLLIQQRAKVSFLCCHPSCASPGIVMVNGKFPSSASPAMSIEAEIPVSFHTSDNWLVGPSTAVLSNYRYTKDEVGKCTLAQWEQEWKESISGKCIKLFFSNLDDVAVLKFRPLSP